MKMRFIVPLLAALTANCARADTFRLEVEPAWTPVFAGDPLMVNVRLSFPQAQAEALQWLDDNESTTNTPPQFAPDLGTNWPDGLSLTLSLLGTNGPTLVVTGAQWTPYLQTMTDVSMIEPMLFCRSRTFMLPPELAAIASTNSYALDAAWYGTNYADPSLLPPGGVVSAPTSFFSSVIAVTPTDQAAHLERLATQAFQSGSTQSALGLALQAIQADPTLSSPQRVGTYTMASILTLQSGDLKTAVQLLQSLMSLLPAQDNTGLGTEVQGDLDMLRPTLELAPDLQGVRLSVQGFPGQAYTIMSSANLQTWTNLATNVATNGGFDLVVGANGSARFYRAVWVSN